MKSYTRKPDVVQAAQFVGPDRKKIAGVCEKNCDEAQGPHLHSGDLVMPLKEGDWIVVQNKKGPTTRYRVMSGSSFSAMYGEPTTP